MGCQRMKQPCVEVDAGAWERGTRAFLQGFKRNVTVENRSQIGSRNPGDGRPGSRHSEPPVLGSTPETGGSAYLDPGHPDKLFVTDCIACVERALQSLGSTNPSHLALSQIHSFVHKCSAKSNREEHNEIRHNMIAEIIFYRFISRTQLRDDNRVRPSTPILA